MLCTLPTVTRNQLPRPVSSAFSTAHPRPVAAWSLSAACCSSSPRWARMSTRPPRSTTSLATLQKTTVLPQPVGRTRSVSLRPCSHSASTASTASRWYGLSSMGYWMPQPGCWLAPGCACGLGMPAMAVCWYCCCGSWGHAPAASHAAE